MYNMGQMCPGEKHMQAGVSVAYQDLDFTARPVQRECQKRVRSAQYRHPAFAPCCPAPVSQMMRCFPRRFAKSACPIALLILCAPVWARHSRFNLHVRVPSVFFASTLYASPRQRPYASAVCAPTEQARGHAKRGYRCSETLA